jgi:colicin import membrane protein
LRRGLAVSVLLHVAVLAWALVSIHSTPPFKLPEPEPVEVALVTPDDIVRLKQGDRNAKQLEAIQAESAKETKKENPKPVQAAAPPPPPPPPAAQPEPAPPKAEAAKPAPSKSELPHDPIAEKLANMPPEPEGPSPEEIKRQEEERQAEQRKRAEAEEARKAEEKRRAEEKKKAEEARKRAEQQRKLAEERRKAEAKKKQFDADRIAALLNKVPDKGAPPTGAAAPPPVPTKAKGPAAGAPEGRDSLLSASQRSLLGAMMKQAVKRCWNINSGLEGIERIVVDVEVRLGPDGRLQQPPRVMNAGQGQLFADAANSALRALVQCEPYDLPADLYRGGWDHMVVTFDPQRMF